MLPFEQRVSEEGGAENQSNQIEEVARRQAMEKAFAALMFFNTRPIFQNKPKELIDKLIQRIYDKEYQRVIETGK